MAKVIMTALSSVREQTGWAFKEIECERATVADVLKLTETLDGGTLFDLLADEDRVRRGYVIYLNGGRVDSLCERVQDGDKVAALEILMIYGGG